MNAVIWVITTCIPEEDAPCYPDVFATEPECIAAYDRDMRSEWEANGDGEPYPGADEAHEHMSTIAGWGRYLISSHQIEMAGGEDA